MNALQTKTSGTRLKKILLIAGSASAIALTASLTSAAPAQACPLVERILFGCDRDSGGGGGRPSEPSYSYQVSVYNPVTKSTTQQIFNDRQEALNYKADAERPRWAVWQFAGINEREHQRKFSTLGQAQNFFANNLHCPWKPIIGRSCVMHKTEILAPRVEFTQQQQ